MLDETPTKILIVDDHPIVCKGLSMLIEREQDLSVCGEAPGLSQAMRLFHETRPRLVIVDISLENGSGLELVKELVSMQPEVRILVHSHHDESLFAERALRAGAHGYLSKDAAAENILTAIRRVLGGKVYLSEEMTERVLFQRVGHESEEEQASPMERLSDRELEVFELIGRGVTRHQIAEKLHLSPKTIETYRENIKAKLNLKNAAELTRYAVQWVLETR